MELFKKYHFGKAEHGNRYNYPCYLDWKECCEGGGGRRLPASAKAGLFPTAEELSVLLSSALSAIDNAWNKMRARCFKQSTK